MGDLSLTLCMCVCVEVCNFKKKNTSEQPNKSFLKSLKVWQCPLVPLFWRFLQHRLGTWSSLLGKCNSQSFMLVPVSHPQRDNFFLKLHSVETLMYHDMSFPVASQTAWMCDDRILALVCLLFCLLEHDTRHSQCSISLCRCVNGGWCVVESREKMKPKADVTLSFSCGCEKWVHEGQDSCWRKTGSDASNLVKALSWQERSSWEQATMLDGFPDS